MVEFEFIDRASLVAHNHSDIELFYVLEGSVAYTLEDKTYALFSGDFLLANADIFHSYAAEGDFLAASIHISYSELCSMMKQSVILFWCNTTVNSGESVDDLRTVLQRIIAEQYRNHGENVIHMNGLYYEMLNILTADFLVNKDKIANEAGLQKFDVRKHEIEDYIRQNFDKQISLESLANHFYLSYAYLSKYIKKQFGMGFAKYLNSVRLNFAVSQLLHSDHSIIRIAMESGFASSAVLNKEFQEKYQMTPTEYRKKWGGKKGEQIQNKPDKKAIQEKLKRHFSGVHFAEKEDKKLRREDVVVTTLNNHLLNKNWNKMINVGTVTDLLLSDYQEHILFLKKELGFTYVRIWDLYSDELFLNGPKNSYNFSKLDRALDFIVKNKMKPYIELANKPKIVIRNQMTNVYYEENKNYSGDPKDGKAFIQKLMVHLLNRYTVDEVESWYFELWHAEPLEVITKPELADSLMPLQTYINNFEAVYQVMHSYMQQVHLGGGGFSIRYGEDHLKKLFLQWKKRECIPEFISCYCYPYTVESIDKERNQSRNPELIRDDIKRMKNLLQETEFPTKALHVTEWNFSVCSRNKLNDHCMKGAYLTRNMIDCIELADVMGYWVGTDLFATYHDSQVALNGSGGLVTKDGIRKPAFYAIDFMNHLGKYLRKRGENYIITDNGFRNWRIVCHNLKKLSYQYSMLQEDEFEIEEQSNLFFDMKKLKLHFDLPARAEGTFSVRIHSVNAQHGSVQDKWKEMGAPAEIGIDDTKYLNQVSAPGLVIFPVEAENGRIQFDVEMEPNEIDYIHITYKFS